LSVGSGGAVVDLTDEEFGRVEAELARIEIHGNRTDEDIAHAPRPPV